MNESLSFTPLHIWHHTFKHTVSVIYGYVRSFFFFCCEEKRHDSLTLWPSDFMTLWLSNTLTHSASLLPTTAGLQWIAKSHPANRKFQSSHLEWHFRLEYNDWTVCTSTIAYSTYSVLFSMTKINHVIMIWLYGAIIHNWNNLRFNIYLYGWFNQKWIFCEPSLHTMPYIQ